MLDIKFVRANPDIVKENIKKKFQDDKLPLVDEVIEYDKELREAKTRVEYLRSQRNTISKQIGVLMGQGKKEEAEEAKKQVTAMADELRRSGCQGEGTDRESQKDHARDPEHHRSFCPDR